MDQFVTFTVLGLFFGCAYAIAACGLVLTYTTTRVFNLAQGAMGMVMAFLYWQLHVHAHVATWLSLVLVLLVIAPVLGIVIERVMMRGLAEAPVSVSLVVTVGLLVLLIGVATQLWPVATTGRYLDPFFGIAGFHVGSLVVSYHQLITMIVAVVVAGALYVLLNRTRIGTAMRAAVDNRELLGLYGGSAGLVSSASWAIGSSLSALGGILLVNQVGLNDYYNLTFLVINAFAAAVLGRLRSLPYTFLGAILLGLATNYVLGYVPPAPWLSGLSAALPTFMLFVVLLFVPQVRLRVGQIKGIVAAPVPNLRRSAQVGIVVVLATLALMPMLSATNALRFGLGIAYALVMLSLVLIAGYGGHVSLAQLSFMGIGAAVVAKMDTSSPMAIVVATLIAAAVGALVALPVLRLTGLYLALATLAFGQMMDKLVFQTSFMFGYGGSLNAKRLSLLGYDFGSTKSFDVLMVVVFVIVAIGVLALRRGPIGRMLIAMRDSQAACGTLGLNQRGLRVGLFALSAGLAGLAGALIAGLSGTIAPSQFQVLQSLPLLLLAVVCGVTSITGAFVGGFLLMLLPVLQSTHPALGGLEFIVIGVGAILLAREPNGLVNRLFTLGRRAQPSLVAVAHRALPQRSPTPAVLVGGPPGVDSADEDSVDNERVVRHGVA